MKNDIIKRAETEPEVSYLADDRLHITLPVLVEYLLDARSMLLDAQARAAMAGLEKSGRPERLRSISLKHWIYASLKRMAFSPVKPIASMVKPSRVIKYSGSFLPVESVYSLAVKLLSVNDSEQLRFLMALRTSK